MLQRRKKQIQLLSYEVHKLNENENIVSFWKGDSSINFVAFQNTVIIKNLSFFTNKEKKELSLVDIYSLEPNIVNEIYKNKSKIRNYEGVEFIKKNLNRPFSLWSFKEKGFLLPAKFNLDKYKNDINVWLLT